MPTENSGEIVHHLLLESRRRRRAAPASRHLAVDPAVGVDAELDGVRELVQVGAEVEPRASEDSRDDAGPGASGGSDETRPALEEIRGQQEVTRPGQ